MSSNSRFCIWLVAFCLAHLWAVPAHCGEEQGGAGVPPVSFTRNVVPALTRLGCNAGACHGSFKGRGELRLSLLGFDPAADYQVLAKEGRGRRVFPAAPERSLLLAKPTLAVPHGGGQRLTENSPAYRIRR